MRRNKLMAAGVVWMMLGCANADAKDAEDDDQGNGNRDTGCGEGFDAGVPPGLNGESLPLVGVALSSAEWSVGPDGTGALPGVHGQDYVWPDPAYHPGYDSADVFLGIGMTTFRLAFRWERLQPELGGELDPDELERLTTTTYNLTGKGAHVILDVHNYAQHGTELIGDGVSNEAFADLWARLADEFKDEPLVVFGLMNEPRDITTEAWLDAANAAIAAIRDTGAENLILVAGNGWDGAHSWNQDWYGTPNGVAMLDIEDPADNVAFEVHQYPNQDSSGWDGGCVSATIGSQRMQGFTDWLRENGKQGFLGEFGVEDDEVCLAALDDQLRHVEENADVYLGWTWWGAGPRCVAFTRMVDPYCNVCNPPQLDVLEAHLDSYRD